MKGNNTMRLNHATLVEALQMYFDAQFKEGASPTIVSVKANTSGAYNEANTFEVGTETAEPCGRLPLSQVKP